MGLLDFITGGKGHGLDELARRLGFNEQELAAIAVSYLDFRIPKRRRGGGTRRRGRRRYPCPAPR